jgi:hypothetical protein
LAGITAPCIHFAATFSLTTIFVPLQDISGMEGRDFKNNTDAEVIARLRQVYDFLPTETAISVKDGIVRIDIPESAIANKEEAGRLLDKGSERAKQGEYQKAVGVFSLVLTLDPSNVQATDIERSHCTLRAVGLARCSRASVHKPA